MIPSTTAKRDTFATPIVKPSLFSKPNPIHSTVQSLGKALSFDRGTQIYGVNEPATHFYEVLSGTVRTYKLLEDGRRQIVSFYSAGDVFGLGVGDVHTFGAEAVSDCTILAADRSSIMSLASRNRTVARQLWLVFAIELEQARKHMMLLMKTAQERVAMFLLQMAETARSGSQLELPMSRQDIADYLGLTIETVSRTLTQLAKDTIIEIPTSRHVIVRRHAALSRLIE